MPEENLGEEVHVTSRPPVRDARVLPKELQLKGSDAARVPPSVPSNNVTEGVLGVEQPDRVALILTVSDVLALFVNGGLNLILPAIVVH